MGEISYIDLYKREDSTGKSLHYCYCICNLIANTPSLPAAKPAVYPQICASLSPMHILPLLIFVPPPLRFCCRLVTPSHYPARRHVCLC